MSLGIHLVLNKCCTSQGLLFILAMAGKFLRKENLIYCGVSVEKWNGRCITWKKVVVRYWIFTIPSIGLFIRSFN